MGIAEIFRKNAKRYLAGKPRGTQAKTADDIGLDRRHLNAFLNGGRAMGEERRREIAEYWGFSYADFVTPDFLKNADRNATAPKKPPTQNDAAIEDIDSVQKHRSIPGQFKNLDLANGIHEMMAQIEAIDPERLIQIKYYISDMLDSLKTKARADKGGAQEKPGEGPSKAQSV